MLITRWEPLDTPSTRMAPAESPAANIRAEERYARDDTAVDSAEPDCDDHRPNPFVRFSPSTTPSDRPTAMVPAPAARAATPAGSLRLQSTRLVTGSKARTVPSVAPATSSETPSPSTSVAAIAAIGAGQNRSRWESGRPEASRPSPRPDRFPTATSERPSPLRSAAASAGRPPASNDQATPPVSGRRRATRLSPEIVRTYGLPRMRSQEMW